MLPAPASRLTTLLLLTAFGCGPALVEADSIGASESESAGTNDEIGTESTSTDSTSTATDSTSTDSTSTSTSTDSTSTDSTSTDSTSTSTDSTSTDSTSTDSTSTDTGGLPCADVCGTIDCGSCPNAAQVDGPGGFRIDATETTVADYAEFNAIDFDPAILGPRCAWKADFGWFEPEAWDLQSVADPDLPVTGVDWCDAQAYCEWTGRRLCGLSGGAPAGLDQIIDPTNEWHAACSDSGTQTYPYGNVFQALACNGVDLGVAWVVPVASLPACEGGLTDLFDMSGNVWEWTNACDEDPMLTDDEQPCRRRGGSWFSTDTVMRCAVDSTRVRSYRANNTGIRCCDD